MMESNLKLDGFSIDQDLCLCSWCEHNLRIVLVFHHSMLLLDAQPVHLDIGRRRGLSVADSVSPTANQVHHHASQLGVLVKVPEVGRGLPFLSSLLFFFIFLLQQGIPELILTSIGLHILTRLACCDSASFSAQVFCSSSICRLFSSICEISHIRNGSTNLFQDLPYH